MQREAGAIGTSYHPAQLAEPAVICVQYTPGWELASVQATEWQVRHLQLMHHHLGQLLVQGQAWVTSETFQPFTSVPVIPYVLWT